MTLDSFAPFWYVLLGATLVLFCLLLWHTFQYRKHKSHKVSKNFDVHLIDDTLVREQPQRQWLWEKLTPREMEVATLVADGKRNAEIAQILSISVRTVENHIQNIYAKLGVHSRTQLVRKIRDLVD
ncbi:MAG: helix-turn-helix transcriptional regulator [Chloroflexi bacterium]|nr:helix-turn-helix transcriptional regulator [Chloroflexota bacterium]